MIQARFIAKISAVSNIFFCMQICWICQKTYSDIALKLQVVSKGNFEVAAMREKKLIEVAAQKYRTWKMAL